MRTQTIIPILMLVALSACKLAPDASDGKKPDDPRGSKTNGAAPPTQPGAGLPDPNATGPCAPGDDTCIDPSQPGSTKPGGPPANWCNKKDAKKFNRRDTDFDGNGRSDMVCQESTGRISIYYDNRSTWSSKIPWCNEPDSKLSFQDMDGDGRTDMVCTDKSSRIYTINADGKGQFNFDQAAADNWCTQLNAKKFTGADFDGDGKPDEFCNDGQGSKIWRYGRGTSKQIKNSWCTHTNSWLEVYDANGDNRSDLVCRDAWNNYWVSYARNNGEFQFDL